MKKSSFLFLDSDHASKIVSGLSSDLLFTLDDNNLYDTENTYLTISSVSFPNMVYPINEYNNRIYFKENGGATLTTTLEPGSYTIDSFAEEIKTQLGAVGNLTYSVVILPNQKKIEIGTTNGNTIQLVPGPNNMYREMGYVVPTLNSQILVASNIYNISGPQYVDLEMNIGNPNYSSNRRSIFDRIPIESGFASVIYHQNSTDDLVPINSDSLNNLEIRLLDDNSRLLLLPDVAKVQITIKIIKML